MILYFSSNGQLLEYVNEYSLRNPTTDEEIAHGFISASGSVNVNALYAYFEGETPTSSQASVTYQMPNGEIYQNASIPADGTLEAYIKFDKSRDLTNFKAGKTYHFVKFALGSLFAVGGSGNYIANFELYKNTAEARAFGTFEFTAQGSPSQLIKNEITETQYQLILAQISNYLPLSGGTITGDLTIQGDLTADSISFGDIEGDSLTSQSIKVGDYIETSSNALKLHSVAAPVDDGDAANKEYVDDGLEGKADASDLNGKLDKVSTPATTYASVYAVDSNGGQTMLKARKGSTEINNIPVYGANGILEVGTPTSSSQATPKSYVDGRVGVSATGSSENEVNYITIGDAQFKLGGSADLTDYATTEYVDDADGVLSSRIDALSQRGKYLSGYDCSTGIADTEPPSASLVGGVYPYTTGDYFIVSNVGTGTKYIPSGTSYNPENPSKQTYTGDLSVNDTLYYNGEGWQVIHTQTPTINIASTSNTGVVKASALDGKVSVDNNGIMTVNGWASKADAADLAEKLDKYTGTYPTPSAVYAQDSNGEKMLPVSNNTWSENYIPQYGTGGTLYVGTPTANNHAATKKYVDDGLSDKLDATKSAVASVGGLVIPNSAPATQKIVTIETDGSQGLEDMPSGTNVVANPTLSGSESDLTGLQVGTTKYKVPSGGGGGTQLYAHNLSLIGSGPSSDIDGITFITKQSTQLSAFPSGDAVISCFVSNMMERFYKMGLYENNIMGNAPKVTYLYSTSMKIVALTTYSIDTDTVTPL